MLNKERLKIIYLVVTVFSFVMIPIYYFTMMKALNWEEWIPMVLFLAIGILSIANYFIIRMEQVREGKNY